MALINECFLFLGYEKTYPELTNALSTFTHNILAMGLLTSKLQNSLLSQLGVSPLQDGGFWPLHVHPRTLTILAHVLLLRQTYTDQDLTGSSRYVIFYAKFFHSLKVRKAFLFTNFEISALYLLCGIGKIDLKLRWAAHQHL